MTTLPDTTARATTPAPVLTVDETPVTCPDCDGDGYHVTTNPGGHNATWDYDTQTCIVCYGLGTVPAYLAGYQPTSEEYR